MRLTTDKKARKEMPLTRGLIDYFPNALAEVAHVSFVGNQQHNPGQELHWSRGKSDDHADCIVRHLIERGTIDDDGVRHSAKLAWRALANLQIELESDAPEMLANVCVDGVKAPACYAPPTFPDSRIHEVFRLLQKMGCPAEIAETVARGMSAPDTDDATQNQAYVYVAGPMRGYEHFNFPAFDAARDALLDKGFNVISPADIDRACSGADADDPTKIDVTDQTRFVFRDFYAIYFLAKFNPTGRNGIVLLDNWFKSTGATAEFNLGKWLNLTFYEPDGVLYFAGDGKCPKDYTSNDAPPTRPSASQYDGDWDYATEDEGRGGGHWRIKGEKVMFVLPGDKVQRISGKSFQHMKDGIDAGTYTRV